MLPAIPKEIIILDPEGKLYEVKLPEGIHGEFGDDLTKNAFSLKNLHRYTKRSVKKFVCLRVLLVGIVVSFGINSKEELTEDC